MTTATAGIDGAEIDIWDVFNDIGFKPHEGQAKIIESEARFRVVAAGRRFGKSEIGGNELVPECLLTYGQLAALEEIGKRREFWIVGPEYSDSEKEFRILWNGLKKLDVPFDKPGSYNDPIGGSLHLSCFGGRFQVHGKSAKHPETLVGEGLSGAILAEAAKLKELVWVKYIRPTLADFLGWALFTSTPEGKNWYHRLWQFGRDPLNTEWASWRMPAWRNPYVYRSITSDRDVRIAQRLLANAKRTGNFAEALELISHLHIDAEIMSMMRSQTSESFNQEIGADFTEFVGRVFKDFDEESHVTDLTFNPKWETYAAVDYGFTNPMVWLLIQVGPWNEIHVLREYYERGRTIPEAAAELQQRSLVPSGLIRFYPDPASPGDSKELSELLKVPFAGEGTGGEIKNRIAAIRKALRGRPEHLPDGHPDKIPQILFDRSCTNAIREFSEYRYPKSAAEAEATGDNAPENPMKKDDHTPEALGRFFAGHYSSRSSEERRDTVVRSSTMG